MELKYMLALTHSIAFALGATTVHCYQKYKAGKRVNALQSIITVIVIFFWTASMYRELFLGGDTTSPYLYAMFGIVQGVAFGMSFENIIKFIKK
jgi:hypothetical protein